MSINEYLTWPSCFVLCIFFAVSVMQYMNNKFKSDRLGGHAGLSCPPDLGSEKRMTKHKIHLFHFSMFLVFLCKP